MNYIKYVLRFKYNYSTPKHIFQLTKPTIPPYRCYINKHRLRLQLR